MKYTLAFLLLIGTTFQITHSEAIDPSSSISNYISMFSWRDFANTALEKATIGVTWINGQLVGMQSNLKTAASETNTEIQNAATITETKIEETVKTTIS